MDLIQALKNIGFTQQEAVIYISLCKQGELNGYEAAKVTGISRSNAYAALSSLVEKGHACVIKGESAKYTAIPKEELLLNAKRYFLANLDYIDKNFPETSQSDDPYITISGYQNIVDKIRNLISLSSKRIYISSSPETLNLFKSDLNAAVERDMKLVIITGKDIGVKNSQLFIQPKDSESIKMIADSKEVLAGKLSDGDQNQNQDQCLYTKNKTMIELMKETFIHEMELINYKTKSNN